MSFSAKGASVSTVTGEQRMATARDGSKRVSSWIIETEVWEILAALIILPTLVSACGAPARGPLRARPTAALRQS
jgi:hypothetical protein